MLPFEIRTSLVCDDIRQEIGGKYTLVGVAGSSMATASFPLTLRLCLWMEIVPRELGNFTCNFRVLGPHNVVLLNGALMAQIKEMSPAVSVVRELDMQIQSSGTLKFQFSPTTVEQWETIREINIGQRMPKDRVPSTSVTRTAQTHTD